MCTSHVSGSREALCNCIVNSTGEGSYRKGTYLIKKSRERSRDQAKTNEYQERYTYSDGCIIKIFDDSFHGRIRSPGITNVINPCIKDDDPGTPGTGERLSRSARRISQGKAPSLKSGRNEIRQSSLIQQG